MIETGRGSGDRGPGRWGYAAALLLAFALRSAFVLAADPEKVLSRWSTATDAQTYDRFGWNLVDRGILGVGDRPSGFCMPGYPLLLAATYQVAGHLPGAVRWVQVFLSLLTLMALGRLARSLGGPGAELLALLGGAVHPYYIYLSTELLTETLFLAAFAGMLWSAHRAGDTGSIRDGVLHGVTLTVAAMTRPIGILMAPAALVLARPWAREGRTRRMAGLLLGYLLLAGVWGAWIARNRAVFGEPVVFDTHGGWGLMVGQLYSRGLTAEQVVDQVGYRHRDIELGRLPGGPRGELEADRRLGKQAMDLIRSDLGAFAATWPRNLAQLWLSSDFGDVGRAGGLTGLMTFAGMASYFPLLILGLAGLVRAGRTGCWRAVGSALLALGMTSLLHAVVLGGKRYRVASIDPVLLVFAAWEAERRFHAWREGRRARRLSG